MKSPFDEKRIVAMVDSFTKTVARNFSRNLKRTKARNITLASWKNMPASHRHFGFAPIAQRKPRSHNESPR